MISHSRESSILSPLNSNILHNVTQSNNTTNGYIETRGYMSNPLINSYTCNSQVNSRKDTTYSSNHRDLACTSNMPNVLYAPVTFQERSINHNALLQQIIADDVRHLNNKKLIEKDLDSRTTVVKRIPDGAVQITYRKMFNTAPVQPKTPVYILPKPLPHEDCTSAHEHMTAKDYSNNLTPSQQNPQQNINNNFITVSQDDVISGLNNPNYCTYLNTTLNSVGQTSNVIGTNLQNVPPHLNTVNISQTSKDVKDHNGNSKSLCIHLPKINSSQNKHFPHNSAESTRPISSPKLCQSFLNSPQP